MPALWPKAATQDFRFSVLQVFTLPPRSAEKAAHNPFRVQFGVRSLKPVWNLPLAEFGEQTDPGQARKRFGFGRPWRIDLKEILRILQVTESEGPEFHCLIIRLSGVRVPVGPPFFFIKSMRYRIYSF
jgi:hypothetical protein